MAPRDPPPTVPEDLRRRTVHMAGALIGLLAIQNLIGTALNLYVVLPDGSVPSVVVSSPVLIAHVAIAFLLVGLGAYLVVTVRSLRGHPVRRYSAAALFWLAAALQEGFAYVATQSDAFSYGMELAFVLALVATVATLWSVATGPRAMDEVPAASRA